MMNYLPEDFKVTSIEEYPIGKEGSKLDQVNLGKKRCYYCNTYLWPVFECMNRHYNRCSRSDGRYDFLETSCSGCDFYYLFIVDKTKVDKTIIKPYRLHEFNSRGKGGYKTGYVKLGHHNNEHNIIYLKLGLIDKVENYQYRYWKKEFDKIKSEIGTLSCVPPNIHPVLKNGGVDFLEMISKYK